MGRNGGHVAHVSRGVVAAVNACCKLLESAHPKSHGNAQPAGVEPLPQVPTKIYP